MKLSRLYNEKHGRSWHSGMVVQLTSRKKIYRQDIYLQRVQICLENGLLELLLRVRQQMVISHRNYSYQIVFCVYKKK